MVKSYISVSPFLYPDNLPMVKVIVVVLRRVQGKGILDNYDRWEVVFCLNGVLIPVFVAQVAHSDLLIVGCHEYPCIQLHKRKQGEENGANQAKKATDARSIAFIAFVVKIYGRA